MSDDPFFNPRNDWTHPSQSIAANMRRRSAASSRADQAKMMTEQHIAMNLRELFVKQQHEYGALETRAAGYQERIAALEAQLAKLSSDWQSVTKDVAVASDNLLGADGVRATAGWHRPVRAGTRPAPGGGRGSSARRRTPRA